jgi:beta-glucosidase
VPHLSSDDLADGRFTVEVFADGDEPINVLTDQPAANLLLPDSWEGFDGAVRLRGRGTFVVPESGTWRLSAGGLHEMRMAIDGEAATDNSLPGAINAGLGNQAALVDRDLEAGQAVDLSFEYVVPAGNALALTYVGAGLVTDADPVAGIQAAVDAAAAADVAVVVVGSNDEWESEGGDRTDLELPMGQDDLVRRVAAANPRTVVVHNSGSPMLMPWVDEVAAVVQAWYPGQEAGNAVADVLLGDVDPSGRMPTTWPKRIEDTPAFSWYPGEHGHTEYGEGLHLGHRWYLEHEIEPQWWFGHGLSYTTFEWGEVTATSSAATVEVTNAGDRRGTEVVQAYVERPDGAGRTFAGFASATLDPGASTVVTVELSPAAFRTWDTGSGTWVSGRGPFRVGLGRSAADLVPVDEVTTD